MKQLRFLTGVLFLLLCAYPAWAMISYTANTGISGTPHDFTMNYTATSTLGGVGQCTMCHTPHKAPATRLLWNHAYSGNSFSWSDATQTAAGTTLPGFTSTWNGSSPKCLSCHDGTVAIGDIAWFDAQAQTITVGAGTSGVTITSGKIADSAFLISSLTGDLKGNHPVAVPYPVGQVANTYNTSTNGGGLVATDFVTDPTANKIVLYKQAGDLITRVVSGASGTTNGIECSSCHDPHNKGGTDSDDYFLRGQLTGSTTSYICLKCHIK